MPVSVFLDEMDRGGFLLLVWLAVAAHLQLQHLQLRRKHIPCTTTTTTNTNTQSSRAFFFVAHIVFNLSVNLFIAAASKTSTIQHDLNH